MAGRSTGRGAAAVFGMLLLLAGVVGAAVLWMLSTQRPDRAVEGFARGPVGCTVTLEFTDTGTFYVYEELVASSDPVFDTCAPVPSETPFAVELLTDGRPLALRPDTSVSYDTDDAVGTSIGRVEIVEAGRYRLVVSGDDPDRVAAIGRDPDEGVDDLRRGAVGVGAVGLVLGGLMLILSGRRSRRAATPSVPAGPGWEPERRVEEGAPSWPPAPPHVSVPTVPLPTESATTEMPLQSDAAADDEPAIATWAPPVEGETRAELPPPTPRAD